jgi:methylmalonyl-CoA mutase
MNEEHTLLLRKDFPPVSSADWEQAIRRDLKGAEISKLYWKTEEGIAVKPFYRAEDINALGRESEAAASHARATNDWSIRQAIAVADPQQANTAARAAIAGGAEAICFESIPEGAALRGVAIQGAEDMRLLIAGLPRVASQPTQQQPLPLSFRARQAARPMLLLYLSALEKPAEALGSIDYDPLGDLLLDGESSQNAQELFADTAGVLRFAAAKAPAMRTLAVRGWQIPEAGGTVVQELAFALAHGVEYLSSLGGHGLSTDEVCARIFFVFSISSNYFFELAKLRAFRLLWAQAAEQFRPKRSESLTPMVESVTSRWSMTIYDAYNNLLRGATEAMSAAIGGCDTIEITPFGAACKPADDFSRRLARNTQIILKREAYLDRVVDPGAGSYYIETLTASLAHEAWKLFQQVESEGGFLKAIQSGFVQREVNAARRRKDEAIAARRRVLLGTNQYPNQSEQALDKLDQDGDVTPLRFSGAKPASNPAELVQQFAAGLTIGDCLTGQASGHAAFPVEKLVSYRAAEGFEALRLRSERHIRKAGRYPRVLLLEFGDFKMRKARADFSRNFFASAGFEIVTELAGPSPEAAAKLIAERHPDLVVLCSADHEYAAMARPLIERLPATAQARPLPVIVAGYPEAAIEQLKRDGVADFIHVRSNAVQVLRHWQQQLGMED